MNLKRKASLQELLNKLIEINDCIEELKNDEECYVDNTPENLQGTERYEIATNAVDSLENVLSNLQEAIDELESVVQA